MADPAEAKIPDLEFRCPYCPLCNEETNSVDGGFDCEGCGLTWPGSGTRGGRIDADSPPCVVECSPFSDQVKYAQFPKIWGMRYRCLLGKGHGSLHRGVRVDQSVTGDIFEWEDWEDTGAVVPVSP